MKPSLKSVILSVALICLASFPSSAQTIVYDNSQTDLGQFYSSGNEFGDQITLDPSTTDRNLNTFAFSYYFSGASGSGATALLRLYDNTGGTNGAPNNLLFTSDPIALLSGSNGQNTETIDFTGLASPITLPNTFTWTIQFSGLGANQAGLLVYGPPNIGSSFNDFWEDVSGTWTTMQIGGGAPSDFAARVTAVPEPGTFALGMLGLLAWAGVTKCRRIQ